MHKYSWSHSKRSVLITLSDDKCATNLEDKIKFAFVTISIFINSNRDDYNDWPYMCVHLRL